jgi:hypothetical protein
LPTQGIPCEDGVDATPENLEWSASPLSDSLNLHGYRRFLKAAQLAFYLLLSRSWIVPVRSEFATRYRE